MLKIGFSSDDPQFELDPPPMTGYTVHTGSSQKFSCGWDQIFRDPAAKTKAKSAKSSPAKTEPTAKSKAGKLTAKSSKTPRKSK